MKSRLINITEKLAPNPHKMFLIDGLGACLSAFFLGVVMYRSEFLFGAPKEVLFYLAGAPCFFALYSFSCYLLKVKKWRLLLKIIAIANLIYCFISAYITFIHFDELTALGVAYFVIEIIIVGIVIKLEYELAESKT